MLVKMTGASSNRHFDMSILAAAEYAETFVKAAASSDPQHSL
jgi:hypothetical protein